MACCSCPSRKRKVFCGENHQCFSTEKNDRLCSLPQWNDLDKIDKKHNEVFEEFAENLNENSKKICQATERNNNEESEEKNLMLTRNNEVLFNPASNSSTRSLEFDVHYQNHMGERFFVCELCKKKVTYGENHRCFSTKTNDKVCSLPQLIELEKMDEKHNEVNGEFAENSNMNSQNFCQATGKNNNEESEEMNSRTIEVSFNPPTNSSTSSPDSDINYQTPMGEKPFVCNVCEKGFSRKHDLDRHYLTHTDVKPFECDECNKGFIGKDQLDGHYEAHTFQKPFVYDKGYSRKPDLERHYLTHTGEKPFVCQVCDKGFSRKDNLNTHYITHTDKKSFVCEICNKGFKRKGDLKWHLITHTSEKPFVCAVCKRAFNHRSNLRKHARTHQ